MFYKINTIKVKINTEQTCYQLNFKYKYAPVAVSLHNFLAYKCGVRRMKTCVFINHMNSFTSSAKTTLLWRQASYSHQAHSRCAVRLCVWAIIYPVRRKRRSLFSQSQIIQSHYSAHHPPYATRTNKQRFKHDENIIRNSSNYLQPLFIVLTLYKP